MNDDFLYYLNDDDDAYIYDRDNYVYDQDDITYNYEYSINRNVNCKYCKKKNLRWERVNNNSIIVENNGTPHVCKSYSPPLQILKEFAIENLNNIKKEKFDKIILKYNTVKKISSHIKEFSNEILLKLYTYYVQKKQSNIDNPPIGMYFDDAYDGHINVLHNEILYRLNNKK